MLKPPRSIHPKIDRRSQIAADLGHLSPYATDGVPFEEKMEVLTTALAEQMREATELDQEIKIQ